MAQDHHGALLDGQARQGGGEVAVQRAPRAAAGASGSPPASAPTSARSARARAWSIARLTTIRCSHGRSGRRRSKRCSARSAAKNASWAMSSAAARSPVISTAAR